MTSDPALKVVENKNQYEVAVAEGITQTMLREGINLVFGIPGGYLSALLDAWGRGGIKSIEGRHEGAIACMAAGYTQASGQITAIYGQAGPGVTNFLTGVAAAYMDSVPMLVICAQTFSTDYARDGHQESSGTTKGIDQLKIFDTVSAFQARPPNGQSAIRCMRLALSAAINERAPAAIEFAADLLSNKVTYEDLGPESYRTEPNAVDVEGIDFLAEKLMKAERPVIVMGNQVAHMGLTEDLAAICEHEIPFATVDYAKGVIPEDHPMCLGVLGQGGHQSVVEYMRSADLVVLLGVRMNHATTIRYDESLFQNVIQVDEDPKQIGRSLPVQKGIVGHMPPSVKRLKEALKAYRPSRNLRPVVKELRAKHRVYQVGAAEPDNGMVRMPALFRTLRECMPREALMVSDTGLNAVQLKAHFPVYSNDGFYALYAFAAMGSGLPMALGVQIAKPNATVVSVIGDGGFLVHVGELNVAVQHNLPVIHVVVKNGSYKSIGSRQEAWFGKAYATDIKNGNYAAVAKGFGCDGYTCKTLDEVRAAMSQALANRRPTVIEVDVDPKESLVETMQPKMKAMMDSIWKNRSTGWPFKK